jgi:hypothetical protein
MSNFLAIATVTAALHGVLSEAIALDEVGGAEVTTLRPDGNGEGLPDPGVNIFLYQVTPNAAWRNADLPTRRSGGELVQRPQAALDLSYLFTSTATTQPWSPNASLAVSCERCTRGPCSHVT